MYVQIITIHAAPHAIPQLRRLVQIQFLPHLKTDAGFISAHLMAHIDHQNLAQLIIYWESKPASEHSQESGALAGPNFNLPIVPELQIFYEEFVIASHR